MAHKSALAWDSRLSTATLLLLTPQLLSSLQLSLFPGTLCIHPLLLLPFPLHLLLFLTLHFFQTLSDPGRQRSPLQSICSCQDSFRRGVMQDGIICMLLKMIKSKTCSNKSRMYSLPIFFSYVKLVHYFFYGKPYRRIFF